ncbi:MAG: ABC transporter ATP-binding protein [Christensenellales bacterium]
MMLVLDGLTRYYGSFLALDHLSLTIHDGELHGFVGPNGAGKTTTMRILATLLKPSEGTAALDGVDVADHPREIRRLMGYMPDFFGVYDRLKAWEYLDFYARCYGFGQKERRRMTDSLLELVNLTDKRDSYVDVLSRGMKQRLCLARALIHDPRLLILDEPASGMDPRARAEMKGILRTLKDMGKTVLISSHILPELSEMCDSLTIIDHGRLVFSGSVEELGRHMSGNAPIRVRLAAGAEADAIEAAVTLIRQYPGVTGVGREEGNVLTVDFDGGEDATAGLLKQLAADAPLVDFHRPPLNLEKVFMEVTQGE